MATQTALKKVAVTVSGLGNAVSNTFAEQAQAITKAARETFGKENWEIPKNEMDFIVDVIRDDAPWKGTNSEGARTSEVRAIVKAYPFLGDACKAFKDYRGELRREHLVKIARIIPGCVNADTAQAEAVTFFEARDKGKGAGKAASKADKLRAGLKQAINNCDNASLKTSLYNLCKKHNIKVS